MLHGFTGMYILNCQTHEGDRLMIMNGYAEEQKGLSSAVCYQTTRKSPSFLNGVALGIFPLDHSLK